MSFPTFQFSVAATFTADPLEPVLQFWGRRLDAVFETRLAGYNQVQQTLLDPAGIFARNSRGVNVALLRIEDLGQFARLDEAARASIDANLRSLLNAVRDACLRLSAPCIVCLCPPSDAALAEPGMPEWLRRMEELAEHFLEDVSRLHMIRWREALDLWPVQRWNDPDAERLGRIPYTQEFFCALGTAIARLAHALFLPPYKVIAFDCDNTLWSGVCGEDGPHGVRLDEPRLWLHRFALEKRDEGALLAVASKNNERDVLDTFAAHPEMPLRFEHFAAARVNWDPKPANLVAIAAELNLGLDAFIFIDDNPRECAEVADAIPEALCLTLPADPARIPHFLRHVWAFDHPVVTEEDRRRNAYYSQSQEFGRELRKAETFEQFLASLQLRVDLFHPTPADLARVSQLTHRTNQFNFTVRRRSEAEIAGLLARPDHQVLAARVSDRFGDYGIVSVVIARDAGDACEIDTFLLSCRVLGRGVEHRILSDLAARALARGRDSLVLRWSPAPRNLPARQFLESVAGRPIDPSAEFSQAVPAASLLDLRYRPAAAAAPAVEIAPARAATPARRKFVDFERIALELSTVPQIMEAMRRERAPAAAPLNGDQPLSDVESRLAAIWRDLLGTASVSRDANFFDIGGHSLLAVLLIVRVKEEFGVELPVEDVYSPSMTLANLAIKIEGYRLSGVNPAEYADLVAEIERLSDEEAQRLLDEEGQ